MKTKKFSKKAIMWKYILAAIMVLIIVIILLLILGQTKEKSMDMVGTIKELF